MMDNATPRSQFSFGLALVAFAVLVATAAFANGRPEYIETRGQLSDEEFYRIISCEGRAGRACKNTIIKWSPAHRRNLTVGITQLEDGFSPTKAARIAASLKNAVNEINRAGSGVTMQLVTGAAAKKAQIQVFLVNTSPGDRMTKVDSRLLRGRDAQIGYVHVSYRRNTIDQAHIALSRDITLSQTHSVVLEELVQSLGLLTDILNPYYKRRSIFAEDCNCTTRLTGQDLAVLRRHYPPL